MNIMEIITNWMMEYVLCFSLLFFNSSIYYINQCQISTIWHPVTNDIKTILHIELTCMFHSLDLLYCLVFFDLFWQETPSWWDQTIQCLKAELGRPVSEKKRWHGIWVLVRHPCYQLQTIEPKSWNLMVWIFQAPDQLLLMMTRWATTLLIYLTCGHCK